MLAELVVLILATAIGWEILRYFLPLRIPVRIAPIIVTAIAYLFTFAFHQSVILAFAAAGGVAIFHMITGDDSLDVLRIPDKFKPHHKMKIDSRIHTGSSHRIPVL